MAHPTDPEGVRDAVAAGADIVVHTTIDPPKAAWSAHETRYSGGSLSALSHHRSVGSPRHPFTKA